MATSTGVGTISSAGIGSGIDVESLITKLMAVEKAPLTAITNQQTTYTNEISALGQIKSALASLQTAAQAINTSSGVYSYQASLADTSVATATANSNAVAGTYSVEVQRLASSQKVIAGTSASASAGGTLTIQIGDTTGGVFTPKTGTSAVNVTVGAGATLDDLRQAINSANAGVSASIVSGTGGPQLVVTSLSSGASGQMKITASSGLSDFAFDPTSLTGNPKMVQKDPGQDAIVLLDGVQLANTPSNIVSGGISGVTLNLLTTNTGNPTQLTITNDPTALQTKLNTFVTDYNALASLTKSLTAYDSTTGTAGILNGDSTVRTLVDQLRSTMFSTPAGASSSYQTLSSLGVQFQVDGSLKLDTTVLQTAMSTNFASVASSVAAFGSAINTTLTNQLSVDGPIAQDTNGLNAMIQDDINQSDELNTRLTAIEARYRAEFTAMDTLVAQMQATSSYLTQQLAALTKSSSTG